MKKTLLIFALITATLPQAGFANCFVSKLARDSVRAIALISDRAMITDLVGSCSGRDGDCVIYANYRNHGYSDRYEVSVDEKECRIVSLKLTGVRLPVENGG